MISVVCRAEPGPSSQGRTWRNSIWLCRTSTPPDPGCGKCGDLGNGIARTGYGMAAPVASAARVRRLVMHLSIITVTPIGGIQALSSDVTTEEVSPRTHRDIYLTAHLIFSFQ